MPSMTFASRNLRSALVAASATLVVAGWAITSGAAGRAIAYLERSVDTEVMLLFVPLLALVLAMVFEVVRLAPIGTQMDGQAATRALPHGWEPGRGEG